MGPDIVGPLTVTALLVGTTPLGISAAFSCKGYRGGNRSVLIYSLPFLFISSPPPLPSPPSSLLLTLLDPPLRDELGVPGRSTLCLDGCPPDEAAGLGGSDSSSSSTFSSTDSASLSSAGSSRDRLRPLSPCPGGDMSWGWGCCGRRGEGHRDTPPPPR